MRTITVQKDAMLDIYRLHMDGKMLYGGVDRPMALWFLTLNKSQVDKTFSELFIFINDNLILWTQPPLTDEEKSRIKTLFIYSVALFNKHKTP